MLGVDLVENVSNALTTVAIDSAGEGDPMSVGQKQLRLSQLLWRLGTPDCRSSQR